MKKHWIKYIVVGILFGVFDFFYQMFIPAMISSDVDVLVSIFEWIGVAIIGGGIIGFSVGYFYLRFRKINGFGSKKNLALKEVFSWNL